MIEGVLDEIERGTKRKEGQEGRRGEEEGATRRKEQQGGRSDEESEKMKKWKKKEKEKVALRRIVDPRSLVQVRID